MLNNTGSVYNHGVRIFRLCSKTPGDNHFKNRFTIQSRLISSNTRNLFASKHFSLSSVLERWASVKYFQKLRIQCNAKVAVLGEILMQQFNFYAAQRLRRASQIWHLYTRLYNEKTLRHIVSQFARSLQGQQKQKLTFLLGVALFSWEKAKITDEEVQSSICELDRLHRPGENSSGLLTINNSGFADKLRQDGWEAVIQKDRIQLWRKSFPDSYLFEYKIFGTFFDVPARTFFSVQTDIEYRKQWDKLVIKLDVVDREESSDCEVVHWVMHYPCPMYSREYVYIRRCMIDPKTNTMVLVSRAVDHPACPENKKYVRVSKYSSKMVIRPHRTFDENGFDYILTYFDDPQAAFPSAAYNWMASCGVPDFVEKLHEAARELYYQQRLSKSALSQSVSSKDPCPAGEVEYAYI